MKDQNKETNVISIRALDLSYFLNKLKIVKDNVYKKIESYTAMVFNLLEEIRNLVLSKNLKSFLFKSNNLYGNTIVIRTSHDQDVFLEGVSHSNNCCL